MNYAENELGRARARIDALPDETTRFLMHVDLSLMPSAQAYHALLTEHPDTIHLIEPDFAAFAHLLNSEQLRTLTPEQHHLVSGILQKMDERAAQHGFAPAIMRHLPPPRP